MSTLVYQAINSVAAEVAASGIAKTRMNEEGGYAYRGIEDVLHALGPLLPLHKLCVLPRVLERDAQSGDGGEQHVVLRVAFDMVSAIDGSRHVVESFGEAIDDSDKGTAKAMSAAYKAAMLQAFCIPVPQEDADSFSPGLTGKPIARRAAATSSTPTPEPPEGWEGWSAEVIDIAKSCESGEAIDRLLARRRERLSALQRGRPELYASVGEAIAARLAELQPPNRAPKAPARARKSAPPLRANKEGKPDGDRAPAEAA
jgi:hypothetical protein